MARIAPAKLEGLAPPAGPGNVVNRDIFAIMAHRPEAMAAYTAAINAIYDHGTLPKRLMELVRLRIAFHNQCRSCMAIRFDSAIEQGVDDALVCSLEKPEDSVDLTEAERAALRFADLFATDHLAIDDAVYDDLREHFDEGEIVELCMHCSLCVGGGRMAATWMVTEHVPAHLKAEGVVAPWGGEQLVVVEPKASHLNH